MFSSCRRSVASLCIVYPTEHRKLNNFTWMMCIWKFKTIFFLLLIKLCLVCPHPPRFLLTRTAPSYLPPPPPPPTHTHTYTSHLSDDPLSSLAFLRSLPLAFPLSNLFASLSLLILLASLSFRFSISVPPSLSVNSLCRLSLSLFLLLCRPSRLLFLCSASQLPTYLSIHPPTYLYAEVTLCG